MSDYNRLARALYHLLRKTILKKVYTKILPNLYRYPYNIDLQRLHQLRIWFKSMTSSATAQEIECKTTQFNMTQRETTIVYLNDYKPPEYQIKHTSMDFNLSYQETEVMTDLYIYRTNPRNLGTLIPQDLILDGENLKLISVFLTLSLDIQEISKTKLPKESMNESRELEASRNEYKLLSGDRDGKLWINGSLLPTQPNAVFKVTTLVKIQPDKNTSLSGLFKSGSLLCTQCEAEGFRRITYSLDRPDILSTYKVRLAANKSCFPTLLTNGNQIDQGSINDELHYVVFEDPFPKPSYLFGIVSGKLGCKEGQHIRPNGRPVKITLWCEPQEASKLDWAMESIEKAMAWDERTFGLIYDLDSFNVVAVSSFNCAAMENKSLNIFNSSRLLASKDISLDEDFLDIMRAIGHEYFHNWTGNRVTCRDWFQLTLKEGLTVFREQLFGADMSSPGVSRIQDVALLMSYQFKEDASPLKHPIRPQSYMKIDNFYTSTVYEKGAEVIRIYYTLLGDEGFKKGMKLYFERHDGQAVTCDDFRNAMADANKINLDQLKQWYLQAGTPTVTVNSIVYDEDKSQCRLKLTQDNPGSQDQPPLLIPIIVGLIGKESKKEIVPSTTLVLKTRTEDFVLDKVYEDFIPSILRSFSAPVRILHSDTDEDLAFLMVNDTDSFNRYTMGQKLLRRAIVDAARKVQVRSGCFELRDVIQLPEPLLNAVRQILSTDLETDLAFKAELLEIPTLDFISQEMENYDPLAVDFGRKYIKTLLAISFRTQFQQIFDTLSNEINKTGGYKYTSEDAGRRQLRCIALSYLTVPNPKSNDNSDRMQLALRHLVSADNMTDRFAAIRCLKNIPCKERLEGFDYFYKVTESDENALNKWFALQASSDIPSLFDELEKLRQHPKFEGWNNPNRVKAVYLNFASNIPHFHRFDGKGYEVFANMLIEFDKVNCISAARLCGEFSQWKRYNPERQLLIQRELERVLKTPGLSTDSYEILSKTLQG